MADILILCTFLTEVCVLAYFEKKLWGTIFTPLNVLSLPFTAILLLTLSLPSSLGFVPFYFPSLLIWIVGLALMAIPSWMSAFYYHKKKYGDTQYDFPPLTNERLLMIIIFLLVVPFVFHLREMRSASLESFGSDEFGEQFAVYGLFGHLLVFLSACSILCFTFIRKDNRFFPIAAIALIAALAFVNQVKSWVIIPLLSGFLLCLIAKRIHLSIKLIALVFAGGVFLFMASYLVIFILGEGEEYNENMVKDVGLHALFYLSSGILGLSEDFRQGILETGNPDILFAPFINIVRYITGGEYVNPINPEYIITNNITIKYDNVRTYFGTIYVNCSPILYGLIVVFWGFFLYAVRILSLRIKSFYIAAADAWFCSLLCMGWFEYYFFHLTTIEIPAILFLMYVFQELFISKLHGNYRIAEL